MMTPYQTFCAKHGVDPDTALWRVDLARARYGMTEFGAQLNHHIIRIEQDDGTDAPRFVSVFPGAPPSRRCRYVSLVFLELLVPQEVPHV